jgi:putative oxidoreductase
MEIINQYHYIAGAFIARVFLGCLFLFQGYDAVFKIKIANVIATFEDSFRNKGVPRSMIVTASWFTSYTELICGLLLTLGLFEYIALYLLGINLIIASIGFAINNPMWDTRHVYIRLIILLFLLAIPSSWNLISLDTLIFKP